MSLTPEGRTEGLLERERELAALERAVENCRAGRGGSVVIEGPGGIGKTSLVGYARTLGERAGMRVVGARGAELERSFPYGVVRQFFESFLFTVPNDHREHWMRATGEMARRMFAGGGDEPAPADEFALLHSLYWMCVDIADERPLMMVLDDAQWTDTPSLNYVEFSIRRLEQLPFMFVIATRVPDASAPASLLALVSEPSAELLRPSPLSVGAVDRLVRERVDPQAETAFARACHEVTGGNPFLLEELVHEVLDERLPATGDGADRVRAIGPRGVSRMVLLRLRRLPEDARRLAAVLSVAPDGLSLVDLATLAGLTEPQAQAAAAGLAAAEIVSLREGQHFTHPVIRTAVYEDLPAVERARIHLQAARLRAEQGRPAAEIAAHLLEIEPGEDPWVMHALREAGREAAAVGDYLDAIRLLTRAVAERSAEEERPLLLAELGSAEARTGDPRGAEHLREAARAIADPERSAAVSIELANVLKFSLAADDAAVALQETIHRLQLAEGPLSRRLLAELIGTQFISPGAQEVVREELAALTPPADEPRDLLDAFLLAGAAFDAVALCEPAARAVELGRRALAGTAVPNDPQRGGQALIVAGVALIWAEDFEFVYGRYTQALADARAAGSPLAVGNTCAMRAMCGYRAGRLLAAEADAATVLELAGEVEGLQTLLPPAVAHAVLAGIERGTDVDTLRALAFDPALDRARQTLPFTQLSWARGELCLALGEWSEAKRWFDDCNRADVRFGSRNPSMLSWREGAALALSRLGDGAQARELAAQAVALTEQFGAPRAHGIALRAAALIEDGEVRIEGLRAACATLERAGNQLELARTQAELGAALRAAGRRTDAQATLEGAIELADTVGASRTRARAAEELAAAGVRPRREPGLGPAALTPSERRVAELAAGGKTNREIAQSLFVTEKTVETHLGHVYDKLGVRSRHKLPQVLTPA